MTEREKEFEVIKKLIKENFEMASCGLFNCGNILGDTTCGLFSGEYFDLDICYQYHYFEIFGTNQKEFEELAKYYDDLQEVE